VTDTKAIKYFSWKRKTQGISEILQVDRDLDLSILRAPPLPPYQFKIGNGSEILVGARVRILGFPNWSQGRPMSITDAIVQGEHPNRSGARWLSIDKTIFTGNSGGPVLNAANEVVGVATRGNYDRTSSNENTFVAIEHVLELCGRASPLGSAGVGKITEPDSVINLDHVARTFGRSAAKYDSLTAFLRFAKARVSSMIQRLLSRADE
jgi:hypothetical protein